MAGDLRIGELPAAASFLLSQVVPVAASGATESVTGTQLASAWGMDYLGGTFLAASAHETEVVTLTYPPGSGIAATRKKLVLYGFIPAYGGTPDVTGDIGSIRFNGDSGANYWSHHATFISGAWTSTETASATLIRSAPTNSRLSRNFVMEINNIATRSKTVTIKNQTGTNDAAVVGLINIGGAEWVNTSEQISTVQLINAGSNNMITGSGFFVLGKDF
jgi:hypothetical protein